MDEIMAMARANMQKQVTTPPSRLDLNKNSPIELFDKWKKANDGRAHPADPRRPMNAESTNPRPRGMKNGGPTCRGMGAAVRGGSFKIS